MNVLFLALAYHPEAIAEVSRNSKNGLQNQINNYQWAFISGLRQTMEKTETLSVLNVLPVGIFPLHYKQLWLFDRKFPEHFQEIGCLNLPWVKQRMREQKSYQKIIAWAERNNENRHIIIYSLYLPYMQAAIRAKKRFPDLKISIIITDLPNELGISSGRRGALKKAEYAMGRKKIDLCADFDGFILLTQHMAEVLPISGKPQLIMEGLILKEPAKCEASSISTAAEPQNGPVVLYSGTLNWELGIGELLDAFIQMPQYNLWLCGKGDMEKEAELADREYSNIRYFGFVSQEKALSLQSQADVLINPRTNAGTFTRYSFPSKTLEYMRSGKPVLCYRLEGIPSDYDSYLSYIHPEEGIQMTVHKLLSHSQEERKQMGESAKHYVLTTKDAASQCVRLLDFIRSL